VVGTDALVAGGAEAATGVAGAGLVADAPNATTQGHAKGGKSSWTATVDILASHGFQAVTLDATPAESMFSAMAYQLNWLEKEAGSSDSRIWSYSIVRDMTTRYLTEHWPDVVHYATSWDTLPASTSHTKEAYVDALLQGALRAGTLELWVLSQASGSD
jgi:hypothetical protein